MSIAPDQGHGDHAGGLQQTMHEVDASQRKQCNLISADCAKYLLLNQRQRPEERTN
jgi:hypothetical protein